MLQNENQDAGKVPDKSCQNCETMKAALWEVVDVLEETKQAFKSKRLETLRKKVIELLKQQ